jgi:hypothetical protein
VRGGVGEVAAMGNISKWEAFGLCSLVSGEGCKAVRRKKPSRHSLPPQAPHWSWEPIAGGPQGAICVQIPSLRAGLLLHSL